MRACLGEGLHVAFGLGPAHGLPQRGDRCGRVVVELVEHRPPHQELDGRRLVGALRLVADLVRAARIAVDGPQDATAADRTAGVRRPRWRASSWTACSTEPSDSNSLASMASSWASSNGGGTGCPWLR